MKIFALGFFALLSAVDAGNVRGVERRNLVVTPCEYVIVEDDSFEPLADIPNPFSFTPSADGSTVDFTIEQTWKTSDTISGIIPIYPKEDGSELCKESDKQTEGNTYGKKYTFTAACTDGFADVRVVIKDGNNFGSDTVSVPECDFGGLTEKIASYNIRIPCKCDEVDTPATPATADTPATPATADTPATPAAPDTPDTPAAPDTPEELFVDNHADAVIETVAGKHWLVCGDPSRSGASGCKDANGDFHSTFQASDDEQHEVRCCSDEKVDGISLAKSTCSMGVWGYSEIDLSGGEKCVHAATFQEAKAYCEAVGTRLCTQVELANGCTKSTGCSHDNDWIWSSTPVGEDLEIPDSFGYHFAGCGHPTRKSAEGCQRDGKFAQNIRVSDDERHEVRCCSEDVLPFFSKSNERKNSGCSVYGISELPVAVGVNTAVKCYEAKTHWEAEMICSSNGARLCSDFEIAQGCTRGSGCGFDNHIVWTRNAACADEEECAAEQHSDDLMGCFSESTKEPQLVFDFGKHFSIDRCFKACHDAGYAYAGLRKGDECACGDRMDPVREVSDDNCQLPCVLGSGGMCGGNQAVSIFKTGLAPSEIDNYEANYLGCFNDKEGSLTTKVLEEATIRDCVDKCSEGASYALASLQEGGKCYCTRGKVSAKSSDCNMPCTKGKGICGGAKGRSLYTTNNSVKPLESLGECKGAKSSWWGDPHMITFDGLSYNCQGIGHFIVTECPNYELQAMFKAATGSNNKASVTDGIAAKYKSYPKVQVSIADYETEFTTEINSCPVHVYVDGELKNQTEIMSEIVEISRVSNGFAIQFPDHGPSLLVKVRKGRGCLVDVDTCIPEDCMSGAVGLLGTPNGNRDDEWMFRNGTVYFPRPNDYKNKGGFDYCTQEWCVNHPSSSLFTYGGGKDFYDYDECARDFPGEIDTSNLPQDILDDCKKAENEEQCKIEAAVGGREAVEETLENDLDLDPVKEPQPDDPLPKGCPEDIVLMTSSGPDLDNWPLAISKWEEGKVVLEVSSPLPNSNIGKYIHVQYPEHTGVSDICTGYTGVDMAWKTEIEVECMHSTPFALVRLYVSDNEAYLTEGFESATIDPCCHPTPEAVVEATVEYSFMVSCVQRCPTDTY